MPALDTTGFKNLSYSPLLLLFPPESKFRSGVTGGCPPPSPLRYAPCILIAPRVKHFLLSSVRGELCLPTPRRRYLCRWCLSRKKKSIRRTCAENRTREADASAFHFFSPSYPIRDFQPIADMFFACKTTESIVSSE